MRYIVGVGHLAHHSYERHTDRYGTVFLDSDDQVRESVSLDHSGEGEWGTLVAVVLEKHPSTWKLEDVDSSVGEEVVLGSGRLFFELSGYGCDLVGVVPEDGREDHWMDPSQILRAKNDLVRLEFH